jgi:hypothetical protein
MTMQRARIRIESGTLDGRASDPRLFVALAPELEAAERDSRVLAREHRIGDAALWLKGDHLPGKARIRHTLRRRIGLRAPRERELANLEWLRRRLFRVPEPLAAGVLIRGGLLRYQFLALAPLPPHRALDDALPGAPREQRAAWLDELAREVARVHSLHYVHRDLHFRNVLVETGPPASGDRRRLILIDTARGGIALPRRGTDHDLGCLFLDGAGMLATDEQRRFVELYASERVVQGRPVDLRKLLERADRRRRELLERIRREPGRWRRAEPPAVEWRWRELLGSALVSP